MSQLRLLDQLRAALKTADDEYNRLSEDADETGSKFACEEPKKESAAVDGPRRHSRSARRVCCPCSGHMSTSVFVIDRGSRTTTKPDVQQC